MTTPLRLAFMGTPQFAVPALAALVASPHQVVAVYTQPPRPAGRGHRLSRSAVHEFAEAHGLPVYTPVSLKKTEAQAEFAALDLDAAVVAAYGLILPQAILSAPRHGCLNIHGSLLPRWRGAAPIQRAVLAGDNETGITIMQMEAGLDTGPMLAKQAVSITDAATSAALYEQLAEIGANLLLSTLKGAIAGTIQPEAQNDAAATHAAKLTREDGRLDWTKPAADLHRQMRALLPWPGVWFDWRGETIKIGAAEVVSGDGQPGRLLDTAMTIACGENALRLTRLQRPGKAWQDGAEFLRGFAAKAGDLVQ